MPHMKYRKDGSLETVTHYVGDRIYNFEKQYHEIVRGLQESKKTLADAVAVFAPEDSDGRVVPEKTIHIITMLAMGTEYGDDLDELLEIVLNAAFLAGTLSATGPFDLQD